MTKIPFWLLQKVVLAAFGSDGGLFWIRALPEDAVRICAEMSTLFDVSADSATLIGADASPGAIKGATSRIVIFTDYDGMPASSAEGDFLDLAASKVASYRDGKVIVFSERPPPASRRVVDVIDIIPRTPKPRVVKSSWVAA